MASVSIGKKKMRLVRHQLEELTKGHTQAQAARLIGISQSYLGNLLHGRTTSCTNEIANRILAARWASMPGDTSHVRGDTCKLCNGTGIQPTEIVVSAPRIELIEMPKSKKNELVLQNIARQRAGLKPLTIKVVTCLKCKIEFESNGDRLCFAHRVEAIAKLSGREVHQ